MNQNLILGGMNQRLIEAGNKNLFYCNNCNNEFDYVVGFFPINDREEYYTCKFCNSLLPVKDLQIKKQNCDNFFKFFCVCC